MKPDPGESPLYSALTIGGEVHYFRLQPEQWSERLDSVKELGINTVATYVPWLVHELPDGSFDFGERHPYLDVGRFLDLCSSKGLMVIVRPGPFVMAELKNEGIGYSVLHEHPEVLAEGWDGRQPEVTVVDYLHPGFLAHSRRWFDAVLPVLGPHLHDRGGPVIGLQLDNEVGMLQWVTNSPDLSEPTLREFAAFVVERHGHHGAQRAYRADPLNREQWAAAVRSPGDDWVLQLHQDLGHFTRERYRRYLHELAATCDRLGFGSVPYLVNIHGCYEGSADTFPLGISQLYLSWMGRQRMLPGTDIYIGDLTLEKLPGAWLANAFLASTTVPGQPAGCLEFGVGTGDYGQAMAISSGPEGAPLRLQLNIAQGQTFANYYLAAGGTNPMLFEPVGDGNDRIAFTGERHGFSAPIDPEGNRGEGFQELSFVTHRALELAEAFADAKPVRPSVLVAFIPDYYMTEYFYPDSPVDTAFVRDLERFRAGGPRAILVRALLLGGHAPGALNIQDVPVEQWPVNQAIALACAPYLSRDVQEKLAEWVGRGGRLLLHGRVPEFDMTGKRCTVLADALGVAVEDASESGLHLMTYAATPRATPFAVRPPGDNVGSALERAEVAVGYAQPLRLPAEAKVLWQLARSGQPIAAEVGLGEGAAILVSADLPCLPHIWEPLFARLGAVAAYRLGEGSTGVVAVPWEAADGTEIVHLLNASPWERVFAVNREGQQFTGSGINLPARSGAVLIRHPGREFAELVAFT